MYCWLIRAWQHNQVETNRQILSPVLISIYSLSAFTNF